MVVRGNVDSFGAILRNRSFNGISRKRRSLDGTRPIFPIIKGLAVIQRRLHASTHTQKVQSSSSTIVSKKKSSSTICAQLIHMGIMRTSMNDCCVVIHQVSNPGTKSYVGEAQFSFVVFISMFINRCARLSSSTIARKLFPPTKTNLPW